METKTIASRIRLESTDDAEPTPAEIELCDAMTAYKARWRVVNPSSAQILDVMMDLGYVHDERNFETCVIEFATALHHHKRAKRKPRPSWRECLAIAESVGWRRPGR